MSSGQPKVLIVDDEPLLVRVLSQSLARKFASVSANSAPAAIELLKTTAVDVIVSDINMPGMSGLDLLKTLRQTGVATPFVVITSFTSKESILSALRLGAFDFIAKPFQPSVIARLLDEASRVSSRLKRLSAVCGDLEAASPFQKAIHDLVALAAPMAVLDAGTLDQKALDVIAEKDPFRQFVACGLYAMSGLRSCLDNLTNFQGRQWDLGCLLRVWHGLRLGSEALKLNEITALLTGLESSYAWMRVRPEELSADMIASLRLVHEKFTAAFKDMQTSGGPTDWASTDQALKALDLRIERASNKFAS